MWLWQDFDDTAGTAKFAFGGLQLQVFADNDCLVALWVMGLRSWRASVALA